MTLLKIQQKKLMINVHLLTLSCMSLETGTISDMRREKRPGWQSPLWMTVSLKNCPAFSTNLTGGELMTKIRVHEYAKQIDKSFAGGPDRWRWSSPCLSSSPGRTAGQSRRSSTTSPCTSPGSAPPRCSGWPCSLRSSCCSSMCSGSIDRPTAPTSLTPPRREHRFGSGCSSRSWCSRPQARRRASCHCCFSACSPSSPAWP